MKILKVAIAWYIVGLLIFLLWMVVEKTGGNNKWPDYYYIWDKAKDVLLIAAIYFLIEKKTRWIVLPALIYSIIRLIWEPISMMTGIGINNSMAVNILFLVLVTGVSTLLLKDLQERWKQKP